MTDKEVGQLWLKYYPWAGLNGIELQAAKDNCALIRKLVEERAVWHNDGKKSGRQHYIESALSDFDIDPVTYE